MCCLVSRSRQEVDADVPLSCCCRSHRKRAKVVGRKSSLGFLLLLFLKVVAVIVVVAKQFRCSIAGVDLVPPLSKRGKKGKRHGSSRALMEGATSTYLCLSNCSVGEASSRESKLSWVAAWLAMYPSAVLDIPRPRDGSIIQGLQTSITQFCSAVSDIHLL